MTVRELRESIGFSQNQLARYFNIPRPTFLKWDQGKQSPPQYIIEMMIKILKYEGIINEEELKVL